MEKLGPRSPLTPTAAKEPKTLHSTAQPAAILDEVITFPVRIDLLNIHRLVADHATHETNEGALIVIHGLSNLEEMVCIPDKQVLGGRSNCKHDIDCLVTNRGTNTLTGCCIAS